MPILLTNSDVKELISPETAVEVMRETYRSLAAGTAVTRTRSQTFAETSEPGTFVELRTMDGIVPAFGSVGMRILPDLHRWPRIGENQRYDKVPKKNGRFLAFDLIFDLDTADLQAVVQDAYLQKLRIAGTHGVAAEYLARADASRVGFIGSGWLAEGVLMGLGVVRTLKSVKVFSPTPANRERFAETQGKTFASTPWPWIRLWRPRGMWTSSSCAPTPSIRFSLASGSARACTLTPSPDATSMRRASRGATTPSSACGKAAATRD